MGTLAIITHYFGRHMSIIGATNSTPCSGTETRNLSLTVVPLPSVAQHHLCTILQQGKPQCKTLKALPASLALQAESTWERDIQLISSPLPLCNMRHSEMVSTTRMWRKHIYTFMCITHCHSSEQHFRPSHSSNYIRNGCICANIHTRLRKCATCHTAQSCEAAECEHRHGDQ